MSRALSTSPFSMNVLALDFSEAQTKGAERRTSNKKLKQPSSPNVGSNSSSPSISNQQEGSLVHETAHITPHTLRLTVSKWISDCCQTVESPIPVLFVALHACGSLTPDILRCFIENHSSPLVHSDSHVPRWYAAGMVVAGCCYNLMSPHSGAFSGPPAFEVQMHLNPVQISRYRSPPYENRKLVVPNFIFPIITVVWRHSHLFSGQLVHQPRYLQNWPFVK